MANVHQQVQVFTQGTKAWFEDDIEAWVSTTCSSSNITDTKVRLVFQSDNDERVKYMHYNVIFCILIYFIIGVCI